MPDDGVRRADEKRDDSKVGHTLAPSAVYRGLEQLRRSTLEIFTKNFRGVSERRRIHPNPQPLAKCCRERPELQGALRF